MYRVSRVTATIGLFVLIGFAALQLYGASPTNAATIEKLNVSCSRTAASGKTEIAAPFVRLQVVLASNLTNVLATRVVPVIRKVGASYLISAFYVPQAPHTLLVITVGEWDGEHYLQPATITSRACGDPDGATPTAVASFTPTSIVSVTPTAIISFTPPPISPTFVASFTPAPGTVTVVPSATPSVVPSFTPGPGTPTFVASFTPAPGTATVTPTFTLPPVTPSVLPSFTPAPGTATVTPSVVASFTPAPGTPTFKPPLPSPTSTPVH